MRIWPGRVGNSKVDDVRTFATIGVYFAMSVRR